MERLERVRRGDDNMSTDLPVPPSPSKRVRFANRPHRTFARPLLAVLFLLLAVFPALAHEVIVTPTASGRYHVNVGGAAHLTADPVDFGSAVAGETTARTVVLTNTSRRTVTVVPQPPAGMTALPAQIVLQASGQAGDTATVTLTYTHSTVTGPFEGEVDLLVTHASVGVAKNEALPFLGITLAPARLVLSAPDFGLEDIDRIDLGLMSDEDYELGEHASFNLVVTNAGDVPAEDLHLSFLEMLFHYASSHYGDCASINGLTLCVAGEGGLDPDQLGDLGPGESITTTWTLKPYWTGIHDPVLRFDTNDPDVRQEIEVVFDVIPFTLPEGEKFVVAGPQTENKIGSLTDPLGEDPLAELRPKGFDARTVFSLGEFDSVDLRAGNLTFIVPIGGEMKVRGPLAYSLNAVYNADLGVHKTLDIVEPDDGRGRAVPLAGEWPDPIYNLRGGWSFHLGRLLPPFNSEGSDVTTLCELGDPFSPERKVHTGPRFVYLDSNGTQHEFWAQLHGDEPKSGEPGWQEPDDRTLSYTRDGSFLRMRKINANERWIEEPSGLVRVFEKLVPAPESLPDKWVLTSLRDRHGNRVDVSYVEIGGQPAWQLTDSEGWRTVTVTFRDYARREADQPMLVDEVRLPGFEGGAERVYKFNYTELTLNRTGRSAFHRVAKEHCDSRNLPLDITLAVPRLDSIDTPDRRWSFSYDLGSNNDDLRMTAADLPTGGRVEYEYAPLVWDTGNTCTAGPNRGGHPAVERRKVFDVEGSKIEDTRYLRQLRRTSDIPFGYCEVERAPGVESRPWAEQVVGVWRDLGNPGAGNPTFTDEPLSSLKLHYFNVWPYSNRCPAGNEDLCEPGPNGTPVLKSGRHQNRRNVMYDPNHRLDEPGTELYLSNELFACTIGIDTAVGFNILSSEKEVSPNPYAGDQIHLLAPEDPNTSSLGFNCWRHEQTWARYEVSLAGNCPDDPSPHCLRDSRLVAERTIFKKDDFQHAARYRQTDKSDYDGLGHYRRQRTWGSSQAWDGDGLGTPPDRVEFRDFNVGVGTLELDANDRVIPPGITLPAATEPWLLGTYGRYFSRDASFTSDPNRTRGGEACFDSTTGHLRAERTWRCRAPDYRCEDATEYGALGSTRSGQDLVVRRDVNAAGELLHERHFGANTFSITTSDNWCDASFGWSASSADYSVDSTYQYGEVKTKKVAGTSTTEINREVDESTGWTRWQFLDSGEKQTYAYDPMGRITSLVSDRTASYRFAYPFENGRRHLIADTFPKGAISGSPVRTYRARYDGLARLWEEDLQQADGTFVTREIRYDRGGRVRKVSSLDDPALASFVIYDHKNRPLLLTRPDNSRVEWQYFGERKIRRFDCVGTDLPTSLGSTGPCRESDSKVVETTLLNDFFGRVRLLRTADGGVGYDGYQTTFARLPSDQLLRSRRTDRINGISQERRFTVDGLGFLVEEDIPERPAVDRVFSNFDTRGNARRITEGSRVSDLSFDALGRLETLEVGGRLLKSFSYWQNGVGNGQLRTAVRHNYRDDNAFTHVVNATGRYDVHASFAYDSAGRPASRDTWVDWVPDGGGAVQHMTAFNQGWGFDDFGNKTRVDYPTCTLTGSTSCHDDDLTVRHQWDRGYYMKNVTVDGSSTLGADLLYHKSGLVYQVDHQGGGGIDVYYVERGMPRVSGMILAFGAPAHLDLGAVAYDGAGNIMSIGDQTFDYDYHSRLTAATVSSPTGLSSFNYTYDLFDNRIDAAGASTSTNQLLNASYDVFGNLTVSGATTATYDELDKLVALSYPLGAVTVHQVALYDHDDLRIFRWNKNEAGAPPTWTLRDGPRVIREFEGNGPGLLTAADFVYAGERQISSRRYEGFPSGNERHYHPDHVGNPRRITGHLGLQAYVEPFGFRLGDSSGERTAGFQGHETDGALTYMRARSYYPGIGRFLQIDPGRDDGAWSLYSFAGNNPVAHVDPSGEAFKLVTGLGRAGRAILKGEDVYSTVSGIVDSTKTIFSGDPRVGTGDRLRATGQLVWELSGAKDIQDGARALNRSAGILGGTPKPRMNKVQPVEGAGPHTGFKRDPKTGDVTGHTTFDENGFITQRTDIVGKTHGGVPTPHTHVHGPPNVAPDGRVFPGGEVEIRPARPDEIPKSGGS